VTWCRSCVLDNRVCEDGWVSMPDKVMVSVPSQGNRCVPFSLFVTYRRLGEILADCVSEMKEQVLIGTY
jgi:hypothetical protein